MCLVWTFNTEAHSSWRWLLYETWRQLCYLFISVLAWCFHGPICFNPLECCRRNWFLFTLIKIIFCGLRSNGQNITSMTLFSTRSYMSTSSSFICNFLSHQGRISLLFLALQTLMWWSSSVLMELEWQYQMFWLLPINIIKCDRFRGKLLKQPQTVMFYNSVGTESFHWVYISLLHGDTKFSTLFSPLLCHINCGNIWQNVLLF